MAHRAGRHQGQGDYDEHLDAATTSLANHRLGVMDGPMTDLLRWAQAVAAGHRADAVGSFHHFDQMRVRALTRLAATARVAAAVQPGEPAQAEQWTTDVEIFAEATGSPWANAVA